MRKILILVLLLWIAPFLSADPLGDEIHHWKKFIAEHQSKSEDWTQLKGVVEPVITKAEKNLNEGRRYYAFHLLAAVNSYLAAEVYVSSQPPDSMSQLPVLEAEWKKIGSSLQPAIEKKEIPSFEGVPAAFRAIGESAFSEIRPLYEASLEYGRNTVADAGFFYLGSAQAQLEFSRYCSTMRTLPPPEALKIPGLEHEIDVFEDLLLASYKPPASIDQHPVFIRTSGEIKQAHELVDAGFYYGALYRLINARVRLSKMLALGKSITAKEANERADELLKKLNQDPEDHTIARIFIEMGIAEVSDTTADSKGGETARAVFEDALPHYFAAFQTPKKESPRPNPAVTVTLVRWPYT
jgi:hypothetical protein